MSDVTVKNINALNEKDKIILSKLDVLGEKINQIENNQSTLNNRIDTLQNAIQKLLAGGYGSGPTVK